MSIAAGPQGTAETLAVMVALIRDAANNEIFQEFAGMFRSASDVHETLNRYYRYTDESIETLYAPEYNLGMLISELKLIGDCDDIAMFYAAIFKVLGILTRLVAMKTRPHDPDYYHVVVEAFEDHRWKRFDPTVKASTPQVDYGQMTVYV